MKNETKCQQSTGQGQDIQELRQQAFDAILQLTDAERMEVLFAFLSKYGKK